jgi:CRISPR-associated endonuclease/helicase Cas3
LLAFDTRIIVDEAHLSTVFTATLDRVRRYQRLAEMSPVPDERMVSVVRMSATVGTGEHPFDLLPDERNDERLRARLEASKQADLIEVKVDAITKKMRQEQPAKAREQEKRNREAVVQELVAQARRVADVGDASSEQHRVVGVVVNRVATARQVYESLRSSSNGLLKHSALLLTGRIRPVDRDDLLGIWLPRIRAGRQQEPEETLFVVATQTVEVGANLDFDALITEVAPLDALRQRFGRLDRLGKRHERGLPTIASIVVRSDQAKKSDEDPVYGSAIAETWKWLIDIASTVGKGAARRRVVDFGINPLDEKASESPPDMTKVIAQAPECPALFPAHLDSWVQTNPRPDPDPDVAPFLHGRADTPADIQVIWRADLEAERTSAWPAIVSLMPPLTREALPVPIYEVRAWLSGNAGGGIADVEGTQVEATGESGKRTSERRVLRWRGKDDARVVDPEKVKPGDTIVVPAGYGGADRFGWTPLRTDPVEDVADRCLAELVASYPTDAFRRPKLRLRLHPSLLPSQADDAMRARLAALLLGAVTAARSEGSDAWPATARVLEGISPLVIDRHLKPAIRALLDHGARIDRYPGDDGIVIMASVAVEVESLLPDDERGEDEPDGDEASFTGCQVLLSEHLASVGRTAKEFATGCGLDEKLVKTLELAGRWHDEGKRDVRFQAWLRGSELRALAASEPIAKSGRDVSQWKPSTLFRYPRGARHEFVSVRLFEQMNPQGAEQWYCDLAKFIIGTHHGFGRPFPPIDGDTNPIDVKLVRDGSETAVSSAHQLHRLDSGWAELFWCMVRRFGWWGLAYLEALLVTGDRTVSAREQRTSKTAEEAAA